VHLCYRIVRIGPSKQENPSCAKDRYPGSGVVCLADKSDYSRQYVHQRPQVLIAAEYVNGPTRWPYYLLNLVILLNHRSMRRIHEARNHIGGFMNCM